MTSIVKIQTMVESIYRIVFRRFGFIARNLERLKLYFENRLWRRRLLSSLDDIDGPLLKSELIWLYDFIRSLPSDIQIVEINPGAGQVTCCLAVASWLSRRRIFSLWPKEVEDSTNEIGELFVNWHKTVIRKFLVPYVSPVLTTREGTVPELPAGAYMIIINHDPLYSHLSGDAKKILSLGLYGFSCGIEYNSAAMLDKIFPGEIIQQKSNFYIAFKRRLRANS